MLKNITRQLFAQLSRHLPHRLIARDPLPNANTLAGAEIPASLTERCLNVAAMDDQEIWRAFDSHPEGLNEGEVAAKILKHGDNQIPAQKPSPWWVHLWTCYRNPFNLLLTVTGVGLLVVLPFPRRPEPLLPQHWTLPPVRDLPTFHVVVRYDPDVYRYRIGPLARRLDAILRTARDERWEAALHARVAASPTVDRAALLSQMTS